MLDTALPRILLATSEPLPFDVHAAEAWLLRDATLGALVALADSRHPTLAVDIDSIEGLDADTAGVRFLVERLRVDAVVSRRPAVAAEAARLGCIGLVRVFAFDSTGLRRSLEAIPEGAAVGLVISPGIVLPHLAAADLARLPRPLVAYGLIDTAEQALRLLGQADAIVLRPEVAASMRASDQERRHAPSAPRVK